MMLVRNPSDVILYNNTRRTPLPQSNYLAKCVLQRRFLQVRVFSFGLRMLAQITTGEKKEKFTIQFVFSIRGICILYFASINLGFHQSCVSSGRLFIRWSQSFGIGGLKLNSCAVPFNRAVMNISHNMNHLITLIYLFIFRSPDNKQLQAANMLTFASSCFAQST